MALEQIITILIIALVVVFAWAIFSKLLKLMFYVGIIIFLLLAANTFFIYKDVADLKENFGVSTKKVLLVDDDKVLTGFLLGEDVNFLADSQLSDFSSYLEDEDYKKILGDSYKLMIFDVDIMSDLDEEIGIEDGTIARDEAISVLKSDADSREKAVLFDNILAGNILSSRNPLFFFSEFKKGNIVVYPETALFKTIKIIPVSFIKDIGKKMFEKTKEKARTFIVDESENI